MEIVFSEEPLIQQPQIIPANASSHKEDNVEKSNKSQNRSKKKLSKKNNSRKTYHQVELQTTLQSPKSQQQS